MYYFEHKIMMLLKGNGIFIAKNTNPYFFKVSLNFRKLKLFFLLRESIMLRPKNRIENHFQLLMKNTIFKVTIIFIADKIQCQLPGMADQSTRGGRLCPPPLTLQCTAWIWICIIKRPGATSDNIFIQGHPPQSGRN